MPIFILEKQALEGIFREAVDRWGVPLYVVRGFNGEGFEHEIAMDIDAITATGRKVVVYSWGDHDPSGLCIAKTTLRKLRAWGSSFEWIRAGLLWEDFEAYNLVNVDTKKTDSRTKAYLNQFGNRAAELDALHPDVLHERIDAAVRQHVDRERWDAIERNERLQLESLQAIVGNLPAAVAAARGAA